jgi:thioredoxin reductase
LGASFRIAIVGSGPAGLSAAARAAQLGISHVLLEKTDHLSDTIYKYQKGKHVMATPSQLVLRSDLDFDAGKREAVLGTWDTQAGAHKINIMLKAEVKAIAGSKGDFTLTMTNGESIRPRTSSSPSAPRAIRTRCAATAPTCRTSSTSSTIPGEYVDEHITVVGSGDAGSRMPSGWLRIRSRGTSSPSSTGRRFRACKERQRQALMEARDNGRMNCMTETSPTLVEPGYLTSIRATAAEIRCDRIIARMGSAAPRAFIESCGIEFTSATGSVSKASPSFESTAAGIYVSARWPAIR